MTEAETKKESMARGGSRGGTRYPHLSLADAVKYASKLVRKTHNGPQSEQTVLIGVFDNKGAAGKVRASALKQYGLLGGDASAYAAAQLAKDIEAATPEQKPALLRRAFLTPKLFEQIFQTLKGDTVSRARIRQVVVGAKVHPDSADECVQYFIDGALTSGLGELAGEDLQLSAVVEDVVTPALETSSTPVEPPAEENTFEAAPPEPAEHNPPPLGIPTPSNLATKHAGVTVTFNLDSTFDTDKLERQLQLLRKFNVI